MLSPTRLGLAVLSLLAILVSFGLPWLEIRGASMTGLTINGQPLNGAGDFPFPLPFGSGTTFVVDASNGNVSFAGLQLEIWLVIVIAAIGALLSLFAAAAPSALPRFAPVVVLAFAAVFLGASLLSATDERVSVLPGVFAASIGVAGALVALLAPGPEAEA